MSALAMWNLGWMYENGKGVPKDFHLAKRHYDRALETNQEAYLPVVLSLLKLHARSLYHTLLGGSDGLNLWRYEDENGWYCHLTFHLTILTLSSSGAVLPRIRPKRNR